MKDVLDEMFAEPLQVDPAYRYRPDALAVYFENRLAGTVHKVNIFNRIADIITDKRFDLHFKLLLPYISPYILASWLAAAA